MASEPEVSSGTAGAVTGSHFPMLGSYVQTSKKARSRSKISSRSMLQLRCAEFQLMNDSAIEVWGSEC